MTSNPTQYLTPAEYLAFERASDTKHEYIDGEIFAMSGAKRNHNILTLSVGSSLYTQLVNRACTVFNSDQRVRVNRSDYTYPDLTVVCGTPEFEDGAFDTLLNPTLLVEVLSPSTEAYDRGEKFSRYGQSERLQEYVLVAHDRPRIEHFLRQPSGKWLYTTAMTLDMVLKFTSIGCTLALADVYEKVTFES